MNKYLELKKQHQKEFEISKHNDKYVIWETRMSGQKITKGIFQNSLRKNKIKKLLNEFIKKCFEVKR